MSGFDLVIRGAHVVTGSGASLERGDIGVLDGRIAAVSERLGADGATEIDATGLIALPGGVDPHVHFNEPGTRTHWEGWSKGSAAAAAGGFTTVIEMPLNAHPPTINVEAFDAKRNTAERISHVDFALWGGVVPGNIAQLEPLAKRGVAGFKAFMSASGVDDFPASDPVTLLEAMAVIAELDLPLLVHAESDEITRALAVRAVADNRRSMHDYLATRPVVAETEAIARATELAHATGCRLHIVHISSQRGVELVTEARRAGVDVSCEVSPHHLLLNDDDAERLGAVAKCAPPLRAAAEATALLDALADGRIAFVASDHSPAPPDLAREDDLFASWGGIAGVQSTLELLLTDGRLTLERLAEVTAMAPAHRFRLPRKGTLAPGADADVALVAVGVPRILVAQELRSRHKRSPFLGRRLTARVVETLLRGERVAVDDPRGRLQKPSR